MAQDRDKLFLKLALSNKLLTSEQAEKILGAQEERRELGIERSVSELAVERGFLTEAQAGQIDRTVRDLSPPERIGGFEVMEEVGKGTVGTVYRARQVSLDKIVALKVLHQKHSSDAGFIEQFEREARAAGKINHPHVVQAIDAGEADGYHYLAMQFIEGGSLRKRVQERGPYRESELIELARAIAQGLANAHDHGMLHRDLKPDNILLGDNGEIKIADLGLAMPVDDADLMSIEHQRMGTPFYMSPEQIQGRGLSQASEIYSLGATLYFAATGKPPFTGSSLKEILKKHVQQEPVSPRELGAKLSDAFDQLILDCLAKSPDRRVGSAKQFLERLGEVQKALAVPATPARPAPRSRKPNIQARPAATTKSAPPAKPGRPMPPRRPGAPASTGRSEPLAVPSRTSSSFSSRRKNVFTMIGGVVGVLIAVIFLLMAAKRNNPAEQQQQAEVEQQETDAGIIRKTIDARLTTWVNDRKNKAEQIRERLPRLESSASNDRLRLDALFEALKSDPSGDAAPAVLARIDAIRSRAKGQLREGVQEYFDTAEKLTGEGRYFDALMHLDQIPNRLMTDPALRDEVEGKITELSSRIDMEYSSDQEELKQALKGKDYDRAIAVLNKVIKYGDELKVREAQTQLIQVEKDKATLARSEAARRVEEENRRYRELVAQYKELADARNFTECISRAVSLQAEITTQPVIDAIEADLTAFQMLDSFMNDALTWYDEQQSKGTPITLELKNEDKIVGKSAGFEREGDKVTLKIQVERGGGTAVQFFELDDVNDATVFSFVEQKHGPRAPQFVVPLGVLFTYRQRFDIATKHFELAQENGVAPTQWLEKLEQIRRNSAS
ncbi:MAG: serine/threonine protein kinase [Planctomycetes bacterium]|nr:serine/threonine protein kinase [Planctomycetota bacterium]